jgi:C-terminal processing protease CtpA/Prc
MKKLIALLMGLMFSTIIAMPVPAGQPPCLQMQAEKAGNTVAEVIEIIMTRYAGSPVTVDELLEAAIRGMMQTLDCYSVYLCEAELESFTSSLSGQTPCQGSTSSDYSAGKATVRVDCLSEMETCGMNLKNFRHVKIDLISLSTGDEIREALAVMADEDVTGIILDLRNNAGGFLDVTMDIAGQLVPGGVVFRTVSKTGRRMTHSSFLQEMPFENIVVLVNRRTASAAEVIAAALQDSGAAVVIGENTYGKGTVQSIYKIRTGGAVKITTEEFFRRNGDTINVYGVTPCILVERRCADLDYVLLRGIEELANR